MVRRRLTTPWSALAIMPAPAPAVSPGSHDLLANDLMTTTSNHAAGRRASLPLRTISTDLAVGATDLHILMEQRQ
jgi:hypothetical protein